MADDTETMDTSNLIDVTPEKDGGVLKGIKREGSGDEKPCAGDKVSVHYVGTLADGTKFDSSRDRGDKFEFDIGKGSVIKAWDLGVATMKKGEIAVLTCKAEYAYGEKGSPPKIPSNATLIFEIELFDWQGEDVSPRHDGSIVRSRIEVGDGYSSPNDGAAVEIHLVGRYQGQVFDERDVQFSLGEGVEVGISQGLEHALKKFKKDEEALLKVKSKHAFGADGCPEKNIPPNADVEYQITLKNFEKAKESWEMDALEKIEQSDLNKSKGTKFFKDGKFKTALHFYDKIVQYLQFETSLEEEEHQQRRDALMLAAHLNLAMCKLKLSNYVGTMDNCEKALEMDPANVKAFFRRGQARISLQDYDDAISDFKTVLELDPENKAAKNQIIIAQRKIKEHRDKEKKLYSGMFDSFAKKDAVKQKAVKGDGGDGSGEIGMWDNEMAKGIMSIEQEMEAFGEKMPEPKYDKNVDYSKQQEEDEDDSKDAKMDD